MSDCAFVVRWGEGGEAVAWEFDDEEGDGGFPGGEDVAPPRELLVEGGVVEGWEDLHIGTLRPAVDDTHYGSGAQVMRVAFYYST